MRAIRFCLFAGLILFAAGQFSVAAEQQEAQKEEGEGNPKTNARVILGSISGAPGTTVVVPIYYTPIEGIEVGRLKLEVTFVSTNLKIEKLDRGIAAEFGDVNLSSEVKLGKNEKGVETSTLTLVASLSSSEPPKRGLPNGLLAYLNLTINEKGRPAIITLKSSAEATELGSNKPAQNLRTVDATVEILAEGTEPAVACFFFTH